MKNILQKIEEVTNDPNLSAEEKVRLVTNLQSVSTPLQTDVAIYRMVVGCLGLTVLSTVIGGFILTFKSGAAIPEGLIALGSAAVGALAGLLAPSPKST